MENKKRLTLDTVLDWVLVLSISGLIMLVGNYVGFGVDILESIPGMAILVAISAAGLVLAKLIPFNIPAICYISIIGILIAIPASPISGFVVEATNKINLLAICGTFFTSALFAEILMRMQGIV